MRIEVVGLHGLEVTDPIRACAEEKVAKLRSHFEGVSAAVYTLDVEDQHGAKEFKVELVVSADQASDFVSKSSGDDLYLAIDSAAKKADRQLRDFKERRVEHR